MDRGAWWATVPEVTKIEVQLSTQAQTIFTIFTEFITILLLLYALAFCPRGMWDLSSPTRD